MTVPHRISAPDGCVLVAEVSGHGPVVVLLHAGGPDRRSLDPFARRLAGRHMVVQPDIRGYGGSVCRDPARHTWDQYTVDVLTVLDGLAEAGVVAANVGVVVAGVGLGSTIALRLAIARPDRVTAVVALGVEDIEDDEARGAEIAYLDAFAVRVRDEGLAAAWAPIVARLPPVVEAMVTDAIRRSDPASIAAAASIARDRSFRQVDDLAAVRVPTLVFAGTDWRHPRALAEAAARAMPAATMAAGEIGPAVRTGEDLADALMPELLDFLDGPAARAGSPGSTAAKSPPSTSSPAPSRRSAASPRSPSSSATTSTAWEGGAGLPTWSEESFEVGGDLAVAADGDQVDTGERGAVT